MCGQKVPDNDERRLGDARRTGAFGQRSDGAMYNFLFRPRRLVDNGGRGRGGVRALQKRVLHPVDQADGEENDHRRPVGGQRGQPLTFGHRGTALHAGDDDGLADAGQRVLGVQRRRRTAEARHVLCNEMRKSKTSRIKGVGVMLTMVQKSAASQDIRSDCRAKLGATLFNAEIAFGKSVDNSINRCVPVCYSARTQPPAKSYVAAYEELKKRLAELEEK